MFVVKVYNPNGEDTFYGPFKWKDEADRAATLLNGTVHMLRSIA